MKRRMDREPKRERYGERKKGILLFLVDPVRKSERRKRVKGSDIGMAGWTAVVGVKVP